MSAEFDDLVARVKSLAMDEAVAALERGANGEGGTYPPAGLLAEAEAKLLLRLWETIFLTRLDAVTNASQPNALLQGLPYVAALPDGGEYVARTLTDLPELGRSKCPPPRDPIHDAIDAHNKPGRANE